MLRYAPKSHVGHIMQRAESIMNDRYKFTFGLEGSAHFMRVAIEAIEPLEASLHESDWEEASPEYFTTNPVLHKKSGPTAMSGIEIVGGIVFFTATYFVTKVFDEFYVRLMKRPVGACVDAVLEKLNIQDTKLLEFRDVVYFNDLDVAVVIRILTRTQGEQNIDTQLLEAHRIAHQYLSINGRKAPIHCHRILDGKVDPEPVFFLSMEQLQNEDRARLKASRTYGAPKSNNL